ncbi:MAG TPA: hypothetical protein VMP01_23110 [Pirellulaceae bacterium]|nr:hypothetical protein [Pirellulaceae bacterium]
MFRVSIRELMLLTLVSALSTGWWLDHRKNAEAEADAKFLANINANGCSTWEAARCVELYEKYGVKPQWLDHMRWDITNDRQAGKDPSNRK